MAPKDPYADSPYDAAGMPTGTTTADYDNEDERRKNQVRTKVVAPESINDIDYVAPATEQEKVFKARRNFDPANFNTAHEQPLPYKGKKVVEDDDSFLDEEPAKDKKK